MNARLILTTSSLLLAASLSHAAGWEKLPPLPEPNGGFITGVDRGQVIVAGGTNWKDGKKNWLASVRSYDPEARTWQTLTELQRPVAYAVAGHRTALKTGLPGSALTFAGGVDADGMQPLVQTLEEGRFSVQKAAIPARTVLAAGGVHGKMMVMCGGAPNTLQLEHAGRDTWAVDLSTLAVSKLNPHPGAPFVTAASAMDLFGQLYIFGGGTWDAKAQTVVNLDQAYALNVLKNSWKQLRKMPYPARGVCGIALYATRPAGGSIVRPRIYLAGGYKSDLEGFTDQAFLYDTATDEYLLAPPLPYRAMVSLVLCDGYVYCLGGEDKKQSRTDAFYRIKVEELLK